MGKTKIGSNRGKPRVWIEGAVLVSAGFVRGDRFDLHISPSRLVIQLNPTGTRKVSGKGDKPIIDLATSELLAVGVIGTGLAIDQTSMGILTLTPTTERMS